MRALFVAAGGGGDAIAAAVLASRQQAGPAGIATIAWDRLIVDPLPGPRSAREFAGLVVRDGYHIITPRSRPVPPAGSTLPRLSGELRAPLILLDPQSGANGMRRQLTAAARDLEADTIHLVDVGGDILGRPGDPGLRSPLADALTASACSGLATTTSIAGPGLDGELPESLVLQRIGDRKPSPTIEHSAWRPILPVLDWHPSEATALLAAASLGVRGQVEIRGDGLRVVLTDHSPSVYNMPLSVVARVNPLINALTDTDSFSQAERIAREMLGQTELDDERVKANRTRRSPPTPVDIQAELPRWTADARRRGVDYVTYRRLAEALGHTDVAALRLSLIERNPDGGRIPLWKVAA